MKIQYQVNQNENTDFIKVLGLNIYISFGSKKNIVEIYMVLSNILFLYTHDEHLTMLAEWDVVWLNQSYKSEPAITKYSSFYTQ